jgi:hypothetical protein
MAITSNQDVHEFTREVPESDTLIALALLRPVKVFQIEHVDHGSMMCIAHFEHDGWRHLYQDGDGAISRHLFFWITSWKSDAPAEEVALSYFQHQFILSGE